MSKDSLDSLAGEGGPEVTSTGVVWMVDGRATRTLTPDEFGRYESAVVRMVPGTGASRSSCAMLLGNGLRRFTAGTHRAQFGQITSCNETIVAAQCSRLALERRRSRPS